MLSDKNLFMMCKYLNTGAVSDLPDGYHVRTCSRHDLDIWKAMPFDDEKTAAEYKNYMSRFFDEVYGNKEDLFFRRCQFICDCDKNDAPVGTCFAWRAYDKITTIHWFKVLKRCEGAGIGRALLSVIMRGLSEDEYPVFLHTQPSSFRAIKLYSDFGFVFLTDPVIGYRQNDLYECLPVLQKSMFKKDFDNLRFGSAPEIFLDAVKLSVINQF